MRLLDWYCNPHTARHWTALLDRIDGATDAPSPLPTVARVGLWTVGRMLPLMDTLTPSGGGLSMAELTAWRLYPHSCRYHLGQSANTRQGARLLSQYTGSPTD